MSKTVVATKEAPAAIGPYSQAVRAGNMLFLSGQIALDPATGAMAEGDIKAQTERVMKNIRAVVAAAGGSLEDIVKTTCYLKDIQEFPNFNATYETFFPKDPPARALIQAAALPRGAKVEIEAVAVLK